MHIEVCTHYQNIIGFKVTRTVLHVCTFAVVSLYTCMSWLPIWWNRQGRLKGFHHIFNHGCLKECSKMQFSA